MGIKEELKYKIESLGGTLDFNDYSIHVDAPHGYVWKANHTPTISIHYATNSESWLVEAYRYELTNLKMGLRKATQEELVEIRWNNEDDYLPKDLPAEAPETLEWI